MKEKIYVKSNRVFGYTAKKEPQMFQEPLQKSLLTEKDIEEIEHKLKYAFPKPYKDFLMAYKMPEKCVLRVYYSDDISASYDEEDNSESMEVEWFNPAGNAAEDFLQNAAKEEIRDYILDNELCPDFYDFLKVVCTHEINGELGPNY